MVSTLSIVTSGHLEEIDLFIQQKNRIFACYKNVSKSPKNHHRKDYNFSKRGILLIFEKTHSHDSASCISYYIHVTLFTVYSSTSWIQEVSCGARLIYCRERKPYYLLVLELLFLQIIFTNVQEMSSHLLWWGFTLVFTSLNTDSSYIEYLHYSVRPRHPPPSGPEIDKD